MQLSVFASPARRGVTLLEVLISIGVVAIGVMGGMALLPLAGRRAAQGMIEDGKSVFGQNWVDEFHTRGMARPELWVKADSTTAYTTAPGPVCIDPYFIAFNNVTDTTTSGAKFPFSNSTTTNPAPIITMPRISLRTQAPTASVPNPPRLDMAGATAIFVSHDDLTFDPPVEDLDPPVAINLTDASNTVLRRGSEDRFSWLATLVPVPGSPNTYTLSVVVFYNRDPELRTAYVTIESNKPEDMPPERIALINGAGEFYSSGFRGGEVRITGENKGDVRAAEGDWVMLSAFRRNPSTGANDVPLHRWYRVVSVGDAEDNSGSWSRELSLDGPDWPQGETSTQSPQVTLCTGVVAVFEKTIRLGGDTLWAK